MTIDLTMPAFRERLRDQLDACGIVDELLAAARERFGIDLALFWGDPSPAGLPPFTAGDPLILHARLEPEPAAIDRIAVASEALTALRTAGAQVIAPLVSLGTVAGVLALGSRRNGTSYCQDDLAALADLCALAAAALRVAQHSQSERAGQTSAEELRLAREIQLGLLPKALPQPPGWTIAAHYDPARVIGGDLYDFIDLPGDLLGILLGDASDKSIPAALMMAAARTLLRATVQRVVLPGQVLQWVNDALCDQLPSGMFVTCFFGILDPATGRLRFASGGQSPPQLVVNGEVSELRARGWPLGMMPGVTYEELNVTIPPGGTIVLFSDGLIETHDPSGAMFGTARLTGILAALEPGTALIDAVVSAHRQFAGPAWEQEDDLTIVTVGRDVPAPTPAHETVRLLLELDLPSDEGMDRAAAEQVVAATAELPLSPRQRERLLTAVAEAVSNAIEHGNHFRPDLRVRVIATAQANGLMVTIADQGRAGEIPEAETPDLDAKLAGLQSPRGWGLFLIEQLVDELRTVSTDDGNRMELTMRFESSNQDDSVPDVR